MVIETKDELLSDLKRLAVHLRIAANRLNAFPSQIAFVDNSYRENVVEDTREHYVRIKEILVSVEQWKGNLSSEKLSEAPTQNDLDYFVQITNAMSGLYLYDLAMSVEVLANRTLEESEGERMQEISNRFYRETFTDWEDAKVIARQMAAKLD